MSDDVACLVIKKAEAEDEGWYRCRISNERGASSVEAELIVVEVPQFVTGLGDVTVDEGMHKLSYICLPIWYKLNTFPVYFLQVKMSSSQ